MKYLELSLKETISDISSSYQYCNDPEYIYWTAITTPWRAKRVIQILLSYFKTDAKILDVGSSQGLTLGYLAQVFPDIQGIDVDQEAIQTALQRLKRLGLKNKISHYNGDKLPFKNESFDGIIATEVFEHVDNRDKFIKELARVLKPEGVLVISSPNKLYPIECEFHLPFLSYLPKKAADMYVRLSGRGLSYDHINHPTYNSFCNSVGRHFTIKDITLDMIRNYNKYYLDQERGSIVRFASQFLTFLDIIEKSPFGMTARYLKLLFVNVSAGWFLVGKKKINETY